MRTAFTGKAQCLDIVNDGENNRLTMAPCGNFSGQMWSISPSDDGAYSTLRTDFTGKAKCLDIVNDGRNDQPTMARCGNFTGQMWKMSDPQ